jgi:endothelin-converting enzyme/putative endopeptidase
VKQSLPLVLLLAACASAPPPAPTPAKPVATATTPAPASGSDVAAGLDGAALDPAAAPCDDFYQFACGGWLKNTPIPADRSRWGRGFNVIAERNQQTLKEILEAAADGKAPAGTPYAKQPGDYYATCMDESKLDMAVPQLKTELKRIDRVSGAKAIASEVARLHNAGTGRSSVTTPPDAKNATEIIGGTDQGGWSPDRDYYLSDDTAQGDPRGLPRPRGEMSPIGD